ncbi:MAG: redoxin family protein [Acidobacteria bacterium]|nr:redoxin family protein [Acidobacteriota bacterium]
MSFSRMLVFGGLIVLALHAVTASSLQILALDDTVVDPLQPAPDIKATVVIFASTDCPISNRYAPEVRRLHEAFARKGVRFWLVYPNPSESPAAIRTHLKEYGYPMPALRDPHHTLVRMTGATVTPEAAVFDGGGRMRYRGRIDDRYVELGIDRPVADARDLEAAIASVLAGRSVDPPTTKAVGCYLADFLRR